MNVFDAVKAELNARQVVESYGIAVRHNGMCCCPFHGDKNPSMKVDEKRFHCFGCGEDGDVIQFAARKRENGTAKAKTKITGADLSGEGTPFLQRDFRSLPSSQGLERTV